MDTPPPLQKTPTLKHRLLKLFLLFTSPGVMLHELSHELICIWQRIPLGDVVYFQLGSPAGYVEHGPPRSWTQAFLLAVAPLFINLFIAGWLFGISLTLVSGGTGMALLGLGLLWLAFGAIIHCLPSPQDIKNLWEYTTGYFLRYPLVVVVGPLYGITILVYKFGMYYVSFPLAIGITAVVMLFLQIDPNAMLDCVLQARWGCWSSRSLLEFFVL